MATGHKYLTMNLLKMELSIFVFKPVDPAVSEATENNRFLSEWCGKPLKGFEKRSEATKLASEESPYMH